MIRHDFINKPNRLFVTFDAPELSAPTRDEQICVSVPLWFVEQYWVETMIARQPPSLSSRSARSVLLFVAAP
jgi:hypothetical protein